MGISLKPDYLKRYKDIAWLLFKYGDSDLVKNAGLDEVLAQAPADGINTNAKADELTKDLEKMGPAFIKLGQLLSTRSDLLPENYLASLARLQDNCEPFSFEELEPIVVEELGVRISRAFSEFDPKPLAAASLGQIHAAKLRDGRAVVVKVLRPGIRETIIRDLDILNDVATFYDSTNKAQRSYSYKEMVEEFSKSLIEELDYKKEFHNLETLRENLKEFKLLVIPKPIASYSTSKILTMERISGKKVTCIGRLEQLELDGAPLAEEVFKAYLKQILVDGFFHADPHPGNVFLTDDHKIALLDMGMVARLTPVLQGRLLQLLLAIAEGRSDAAASTALEIGTAQPDFDEKKWNKHIDELVRQAGASMKEMQVGKVVLGITRSAGDCGVKVPSELTMLGKALLNLDQVGCALDMNFSPNESVRKNAMHIVEQRALNNVSPGHMLNAMIETSNFADRLPARFNKIMELVANNKLKVKVDAIDEAILIDAVQKIANRITLGLVLASLIVGASLLMRVPSSFQLFGYPGLAIICFVCAAGGGFALAIQVAFYDQKPQKLSAKNN